MSKSLTIIWQYLRAFVLIYACLYAGIFIAGLLPITIPGCNILIRYMALLFVPIGVGVMQYWDLLRAQLGPVVISCAISTLVVFVVVSWSSHLVHGERKVIGQKGKEE